MCTIERRCDAKQSYHRGRGEGSGCSRGQECDCSEGVLSPFFDLGQQVFFSAAAQRQRRNDVCNAHVVAPQQLVHASQLHEARECSGIAAMQNVCGRVPKPKFHPGT
jgi:hypothetical protein